MNNMKNISKRALSLFVALAMCLGMVTLTAFAAETVYPDGCCVHHPVHTAECGYSEGTAGVCEHDDGCGYSAGTAGSPCTHEHDAECGGLSADSPEIPADLPEIPTEHDADCPFTEGTDGVLCDHVHDAECGYREASEGSACNHVHTEECGEDGEDCTHSHDESCGYEAPDEGAPCSHSCEDGSCSYAPAVEPVDCTCDLAGRQAQAEAERQAAIEAAANEEVVTTCNHEHDESCGYSEGTEATPCAHQTDGSDCAYNTVGATPCEFNCPICESGLGNMVDGSAVILNANGEALASEMTVVAGESINLADLAEAADGYIVEVYSASDGTQQLSTGNLTLEAGTTCYVVYVAKAEAAAADLDDDQSEYVAAAELKITAVEASKVTIETNLQSLSLTNSSAPVELQLLAEPYVKVTKVNAADAQLEVSVTRQLGGQTETVTLGEGSTLTVTYQDVGATYTVEYTAYVMDEEEKQVLATAQATFSVADYNRIPDKMEGDEAYISSASLTSHTNGYNGQYLLTGTEPFDTNQASGNGYDKSQGDLYVRTYDTVTYQVTYSTQMQNDAQTTNVGSGRVCYELVLPVDETKATFDLGGSAWIKTNAEAAYKQETVDGKQVIRGSFLMQAGSEGGAAIGSSYQTLTISIRVLNMKNDQTLQPEFTFWLEGNQVAENYQYETVTANNGAQVNIPSGALVTGSEYVCPTHNHAEFQTVTPEAVIISARPMYNLNIKGSGADDLGSYDFSTGNGSAPNKDAGTRYGYLTNYALTLELDGQANRGLRGLELLDGGDITFDIRLSGSRNVPAVNTAEFAPLYWSMGGMNNNRTKQDGRYVSATNAAPYGKAPFNQGNSQNACYNGGTWTFVQDASDPNLVHVTVSGYEIDLTSLPCQYFGDTSESFSVYNPTQLGDAYWDLEGKAIFATGEVWVVQPLYSGRNGADGESMGDAAQADVRATVQLESVNKNQLTIGGTQYPQMYSNDQEATTSLSTVPSGNVDNRIYYMSIPSGDWDPLTPGQLYGDGDWARIGMPVEIRADLTYDNHLGQEQGAAYDMMIKFDDEFFEPTGGIRYSMPGGFINSQSSKTTFWATKAGGWSSDDEMKKTGADSTSLTWHSSLKTAQASDDPIVACLTEFRGLTKELTSHMHVFIQGKVKDTAVPGTVYMVTHDSYVWSIGNLGLTGRDDITLEEINAKIPSQGNTDRKLYSQYPTWTWRGTGTDDPNSNAIPDYEKATYENGLYTSHGISSYGGDSCLVLAYTTEITNVVAQTMIEGEKEVPKTTFSLDYGERVVDFMATPGIVLEEVSHSSSGTGTPSEKLENVIVTAILPDGLTYIAGSSYWGGDYTQDSEWKNKGTVTGGIQLGDPTSVSVPVFNEKGEQTGTAYALQWTLENVNVNKGGSLAPIYYSCTIGTADNFDTDVKKGVDLNVTMRVQSESDMRPTLETNDNLKNCSITVTREQGANVVKTTQTPVVETGTSATFVYDMQVTNSSTNEISNAVVVEGLPYPGEGSQSNFTGTLTLTDFDWKVNGTSSTDLTFYYTMDERFKGASSANVTADTVKGWNTLSTGSNLDLAGVTAIAAVGKIPAQAVLSMTVTLSLSKPKPGEYLVNTISCNSINSSDIMTDSARSAVASRRLEGLTWLDANRNGRQDSGEKRLPSVTVELYQWVDDEYQLFTVDGKEARIVTGQQMDVSTGDVSDYSGTDAAARYLFTNLPKGTFAVRFCTAEEAVDLSRYAATTPNAENVDDQYDSDGVPKYDETSNLLTETWIKDINMPDIKSIPTGGVYESKYHDSGFFSGDLTITKVIVNDDEYPSDKTESTTIVVELKATSETKDLLDGEYPYELKIGEATQTGTVTFSSSGIAKLDGTTNWKFTGNATLVIHGLPVGAKFTVMEYNDANTNPRIDGYDLTVNIEGNVGQEGNKSHKFIDVAIALDDDGQIVNPSMTITNTYKRDTGSLTITKTVSGLAVANAVNRTYTFTVEAVEDALKKDVRGKTFDGLTFEEDGTATVTIEVDGNDSVRKTFTGLPTGEYKVTEDTSNAQVTYYKLGGTHENTVEVIKTGSDVEAELINAYTYDPNDNLVQLTIQKVLGDGVAASTNEYEFKVSGTTVQGESVEQSVNVQGGTSYGLSLERGKYTITEVEPEDKGLETGYTWTGVEFSSDDSNVTIANGEATIDMTGTDTVAVQVTATNRYTRDTGSLTITKEVAGGVSAESVEEKVFQFEVTGPVDANGTYSGVNFENGKATVEITGANSVTIENLPTGEYSVAEDQDSAQVSGRWLSSVTYTDSDEGDAAITNDGTVTLVKGADNSVTVVNTYRTPGSPTPDPSPDPDPAPSPDPEPDPEPAPSSDPDQNPDEPNVDIPDEDTPLVDQPDPSPDVNIPEEDVPLAEFPEEDVPLAEIPEEDVPLAEFPEEDVPLADVPNTGDKPHIWGIMALVSGIGLAWLALNKKRKDAAE